MNHSLGYSLFALLTPLLPLAIWQGKQVRATTLRLPEAQGEREGLIEASSIMAPTAQAKTEPLTLLHLGESTAAGVGIEHIDDSLGFLTSQQLANQLQRPIRWKIQAQTGITSHELLDKTHLEITADSIFQQPDVLIITLGVNDTTSFARISAWKDNLCQLIDRHSSASTRVVLTQVPPMQNFPALPKPLNWLLGIRAWQLNQVMKHMCQQQGWHHQSFNIPLQPEWMATDGYHPNAQGYRLWAEGLSDMIADILCS